MACPMNKAEEAEAVAAILAQQDPSVTEQTLIVAALLQPSHCYPSAAGAPGECSAAGNDFSPFASSLSFGNRLVHLWIEVGPDVTSFGLGDANVTSLVFSPNNYDGGRLAGLEYCTRAHTSRPQHILALYGDRTAAHSTARLAGFEDAIAEECPQHKVVSRDYADWSRSRANQVAASYFVSDGTISSVVCANDESSTKLRHQTLGRPALGPIGARMVHGWRQDASVDHRALPLTRPSPSPSTFTPPSASVSASALASASDLSVTHHPHPSPPSLTLNPQPQPQPHHHTSPSYSCVRIVCGGGAGRYRCGQGGAGEWRGGLARRWL